MRQWFLLSRLLCGQHLRGEHFEHHKFLGNIKKGRSVRGYIEKNFLVPQYLNKRHDEIVEEMEHRGYNHRSPLEDVTPYLDTWMKGIKMNSFAINDAWCDLVSRCDLCKARTVRYFIDSFPMLNEQLIKSVVENMVRKGNERKDKS